MNLCCNKHKLKQLFPILKNLQKNFDNLESLSKASENKILKLWEGLGYYRRARNLLATSKIIVKKYNSKLPRE